MKICYQLLKAKMEWTGSKISFRVKSASVDKEREEGATELKNNIDSLTAILKSSTLGISKPKGKEKKKRTRKPLQNNGQRKGKSTLTTPTKGKGLGTPATSSSKGNQKPIQYY